MALGEKNKTIYISLQKSYTPKWIVISLWLIFFFVSCIKAKHKS